MRPEYSDGATPLDPNELDGLVPNVTTQAELNELEKANILQGLMWAGKSRNLKKELITYSGLMQLHYKLFGEVWKWAGTKRTTEKNIGVDPLVIPERVNELCKDVQAWVGYKTYPWPEMAVRFHHRLVAIHPFPNGNGRHARIAANLLLRFNRQPELHWGRSDLLTDDQKRKEYLTALKLADQGDCRALLKFALS